MIQHTEPDYYGRCTRCGERLEAPSQAMRDRARGGGEIRIFTARVTIAPEFAEMLKRFPCLAPHPCEAPFAVPPSTPEEPT